MGCSALQQHPNIFSVLFFSPWTEISVGHGFVLHHQGIAVVLEQGYSYLVRCVCSQYAYECLRTPRDYGWPERLQSLEYSEE